MHFWRRGSFWFWGGLTAVTVVSLALAVRRFVAPRIVGRAVSPTGVEMSVLQSFRGEYETRFVYRRPGTNWAWCYFDHEDNHWGIAPVVVDTNQGIATFYRDGRPALSFEWKLGIYRSGRLAGTTGGVPEEPRYMPADWSPAKDGYR